MMVGVVGGGGGGGGVGGAALVAVRSSGLKSPLVQAAVWSAGLPPTRKVTVAPALPQPLTSPSETTSSTYAYVSPPATAVEPHSTPPMVADTTVPPAAGPPSRLPL